VTTHCSEINMYIYPHVGHGRFVQVDELVLSMNSQRNACHLTLVTGGVSDDTGRGVVGG